MIDSNILEYTKLEALNVSRETFPELEEFRSLILNKNKVIERRVGMFIIDIGLMEAHAMFHTCLVNNIFGDLYSVQHFHIKWLE